MSDLMRVMNPDYKPKNTYERILRWLGYLHQDTGEDFQLSDSELEHMAMKLAEGFESDKTTKKGNNTPLVDQPIILHYRIINDPDLRKLELQGFVEGTAEGKTMDVPFGTLVESLDKQCGDFFTAYNEGKGRKAIKKALADIRNVAGCCFLKLKETK